MPNRDGNPSLEPSQKICPCDDSFETGPAEAVRVQGRFTAAAAILLMVMAFRTIASQSVELAWNPSASTNIVGYIVYYGGAINDYTNEISVGNLTNLKVSGLVEGTTYFFAIKAVNSAGFESGCSAPISYSVPTTAAIMGRPVFSNNGVSTPVTGMPGYLYVIQVSTNLVNWTSLETNLAPLQFTDQNASQYKRRFYRAVYVY